MPKIEWDATGEKLFECGVDRGVLYVQKADGSYETGVPWNGLTNVTESPSGAEATDIWADNIKYATLRSAETYGATIEAYMHPDEFYQCDGSTEVSNAKGVFLGQQNRKPFGFCYRTKVGSDTEGTDSDHYKIHIIYNLTASPSERSHQTLNDSPDAVSMSWTVSSTPVACEGYKPVSSIVIDSVAAKNKMSALEEKLYGGTGDATLPSPKDLLTLMSAGV